MTQTRPSSSGPRPAESLGFGSGSLVVVAIFLLLPWLFRRVEGGGFYNHLLVTFFVWAVVAQCWNLVIGVCGIHSFAQLALYALGGYTTGILSKVLGWNAWLGLLGAPVVAVAAALILGVLTLRLRGAYTVLMTLAFHELLRQFVANGPQVISNGGFGLLFVPKLSVPGLTGPGMDAVTSYHLALGLFVATTVAIGWVLRSPVGLSFQALRDAETYAVCRGVDPFRHKLFVFACSAVFTGLAGGLMTHHQGAISPSSLDFGLMIQVLAMIVIGGWGTFHGPIVGAATLTALIEFLERFKDQRPLILGLTLAFVAVAAPQGLLPLAMRAFRKRPPVQSPVAAAEPLSGS